jgi:ureidoglycolate amidohydrolase
LAARRRNISSTKTGIAIPSPEIASPIRVDQARVNAEIDALAAISDADAPAVARIVFSERDLQARAWLRSRFREAGLDIQEDAIGNTFARWPGSSPHLPAVATGSHIDAIPYAGRYDGVVGVIGALEAIRALRGSGFQPARSIELIQFTAEEPTRFGIGCLGSRLMSGTLDAAAADALLDNSGEPLHAVRERAGFPGDLAGVRLPAGHYAAFVELHIEQGPELERTGTHIGAITHIAAPATLRVIFEGEGGHAGARLMPGRRDALCAAADAVLAVERAALATRAIDTVATVGVCDIHPGAVNSIPSRVRIEIDVRDIDEARRDSVLRAIESAIDEISARRSVTAQKQLLNSDPPAACDAAIVDAVERACRASDVTCRRMVSRAYHDTLFMARICPSEMIFIPCRGGISHRPDEYAAPAAISAGIQVLARTLAELSAY